MNSPRKYDALLVTTSDISSGRSDDLNRLISSIQEAIDSDGIKVLHYLLLQRFSDDIQIGEFPDFVKVYKINNRISLSKARNFLLSEIFSDGVLGDASVVGFPDDDAWYPKYALNFVTRDILIAKSDSIDVFACRYSSTPNSLTAVEEGIFQFDYSLSNYISCASSNTLFLKSSLVEEIGWFDERLGVGADINGGEDLDYALRAAVICGNKIASSRMHLIGHRDRLKWVRSRYFSGSLFALTRSAKYSPRIMLQMFRKILVGLYFVSNREMSLSDWFSGAKIALSSAWGSNPLSSYR